MSIKLGEGLMFIKYGALPSCSPFWLSQVLSIICNTICQNFHHYQAPLQSLGLFLLITSRISDFKCQSY